MESINEKILISKDEILNMWSEPTEKSPELFWLEIQKKANITNTKYIFEQPKNINITDYKGFILDKDTKEKLFFRAWMDGIDRIHLIKGLNDPNYEFKYDLNEPIYICNYCKSPFSCSLHKEQHIEICKFINKY